MKKPSMADLVNNVSLFSKILKLQLESTELKKLINSAQLKYTDWEKFKFYKTPSEFNIEEAWLSLILKRSAGFENSPILTPDGTYFKYSLTKEHLRLLSLIDTQTSGSFATDIQLPEGKQKERLIINGLIEEAINSSQLEGASTSRAVAKNMIKSGRPPRNESETMVLNNFYAMEKIETWKNQTLDESFLLEIHSILTEGILPNSERGQFRNDSDNVFTRPQISNFF
jgi:hypothetical protein